MNMSIPLADGLLSSIAGLPLHPLVVHLAVIVLPLAALSLVALVIWPRLARRYASLTVAGLAVGTLAAFVAKESGEELAQQVGEPAQHAAYGDVLPLLATVLLLLALGWYFLQRRDAKTSARRSTTTLAVGILASLAAVATLGLTVLVGHSGAVAVWGDAVSAISDAAQPTETAGAVTSPTSTATASRATPSASATPKPSSAAPNTFSLADVAKHASAASCWSAVNGSVYDLTSWIDRHPGGRNRILSMCGKDASSAFDAQHGGQRRPESELKAFKIGSLR